MWEPRRRGSTWDGRIWCFATHKLLGVLHDDTTISAEIGIEQSHENVCLLLANYSQCRWCADRTQHQQQHERKLLRKYTQVGAIAAQLIAVVFCVGG